MGDSEIWTKIGAPILLAIATLSATYLNNLRLAQRKEQLELIDRQLRDLYGPLVALCTANNMAYHQAFRTLYRPKDPIRGEIPMWDPPSWDPDNWPTEEDIAAFQLWTKEVFMPINRDIFQRIVNHTDLLLDPEMPQCLLDLLAHIVAYEGLIKEWESGRSTHKTPTVRFPGGVKKYAEDCYKRLKKKQAFLQGRHRKYENG